VIGHPKAAASAARIVRALAFAVMVGAGMAGQTVAQAQDAAAAAGGYSEKGADTCLECHADVDGSYSPTALFKTPHARRGDARAPFGPGGLQCEACHGPGAEHARKKKASAINTFKADSKFTLTQRNQACLNCHTGGSRTAWHAGAHERAGLACTDCHQVHREHDPGLRKTLTSETCLNCHKTQRAAFQKLSSHPVRQGAMSCVDCHSPHGSSGPAMLSEPTLNQTCNRCHADKRGPVLWEHQPVAEDCSLCHTAHGSIRAALLNKSPPQLCQQCHSAADHPSVARTGSALPANGGTGAIFVVAGSCTNCHSQVHGSNHPSGAYLMR
jgi:DmsE family decaheme c-type cytochrome